MKTATPHTRHAPSPSSWLALTASLVLSACATNYQGGVGPLASPKAAQIVDLGDELWTRALRLNPNTVTEAACFSTTSDIALGRALEMTGLGLNEDVKSAESRLWKSSAIPASATLETRCLNRAHAAFEQALFNKPSQAVAERNSLQDRLISASDQSCGLFKKYLNASQASTNFLFGSSSLALAAVATNVTSAAAAKNYTTGALIGSGVSAQFNVDMFNSQVTFAIAKAIDINRKTELEKLYQQRNNKTYETYGISAAIGDALRYHELCSLMSGLAAMDKSMTVMSDPGLKHMASWFPSGQFVIDEGVISAKNLKTEVGGILSNGRSNVLPTLADIQFKTTEQHLNEKLSSLKQTLKIQIQGLPSPQKEAVETAQQQLQTNEATQETCPWSRSSERAKFLKEGVLTCTPGQFLEALCFENNGECSAPQGSQLVNELSRNLRETHHAWSVAQVQAPIESATKAKRADYENALSRHQSFVQYVLQPAAEDYLSRLNTIQQQAQQAAVAKP